MSLGQIFIRWGIPLTLAFLALIALLAAGVISRLLFGLGLVAILVGYWIAVVIVLRRSRKP